MGDYEREGLPGILRWAADDAEWRPHSAGGRVFRSTAEYREQMQQAQACGIRVESTRLGLWSEDDVVVVRGRMRTRRGGVLDDTRMYWLHRVGDGKVVWTASTPDLAGLIEDAGLEAGLASEAHIASTRGGMTLTDEIRAGSGRVAAEARSVRIVEDKLEPYARELPAEAPPIPDLENADDETRAAFSLQLNAINFGSGWFPTLNKPQGLSGYRTVEAGLRARGPWTATELTTVTRLRSRRRSARTPTTS